MTQEQKIHRRGEGRESPRSGKEIKKNKKKNKKHEPFYLAEKSYITEGREMPGRLHN